MEYFWAPTFYNLVNNTKADTTKREVEDEPGVYVAVFPTETDLEYVFCDDP